MAANGKKQVQTRRECGVTEAKVSTLFHPEVEKIEKPYIVKLIGR